MLGDVQEAFLADLVPEGRVDTVITAPQTDQVREAIPVTPAPPSLQSRVWEPQGRLPGTGVSSVEFDSCWISCAIPVLGRGRHEAQKLKVSLSAAIALIASVR